MDENMDEPLDEPRALVLWCTYLPQLRRLAQAGRWTDRLERTVRRVRDGGSALAACEQFGLVKPAGAAPAGPSRGPGFGGSGGDVSDPYPSPYPAVGLRPAPPVGLGDYRCPRGQCSRRAQRDENGHPPTCALFDDEPMKPAR